jgi:hypothetical protein
MTDDDSYDKSFETGWYNNHPDNDSTQFKIGGQSTTIHYKIIGDYLQAYIEVPLEAKNMIWGTGVTEAEAHLYYRAFCSPSSGDPADDGSNCTHHNNGFDEFFAKISSTTEKTKDGSIFSESFAVMTGSEKIVMLDGVGEFNLQVYDPRTDGYINKAPNDSALEIRTSLDYLIDGGFCDLISCNAFDVPMSFEILFEKDIGLDVVNALMGQTDQLIFHLSPERGGISEVPAPATAWLFGTALIGLVGFGRKRKAI